jgi:hypothetical protein
MSRPKITSGGGNYKVPVIDEAKKVFGKNPLTLAEARTFVSGYTIQIQNDLIASGDLIRVPTTSGYVHNSLVSGLITFYSSSPGLYKFKYENGRPVLIREA